MGSANHGRMLIGIALLVGLVALVVPGTPGCNSGRNKVSSEAFSAPQPIAAKPSTGDVPVELAASKLEILREVYRDKETGITKLDSELKNLSARLIPVGKLDDDRLLIFEEISKAMITFDFSTNTTVKNWDREEVLALFRGQAQKPAMNPVIRLSSGWLLGYETTSRSLFAIKADAADPSGLIGMLLMDQSEIQDQVYPVDCVGNTDLPVPYPPRTSVAFKSMLEFEPGHILVVPASSNVPMFLHLEVEDLGTSLEARFIVNDCEPFLYYKTQIQPITGNIDIDVKDCPPVQVPGTNDVVIFDRAKDTSSFLVVHIRNTGGIYSTFVELGATRNDLLAALEDVNKGGEAFTGQFKLVSSFAHIDASRPVGDVRRTPLVLAYDDETNNMFAFDFDVARGTPGKVSVFTSSTMISNRTDLNYDPALDAGTADPILSFGVNNVVQNRLAFDAGLIQLVSFNYDVGQVAVVLHKRDITSVTSAGLVELNYVEALDPPPGKGANIRLVDLESSSILALRVEYVPVPVSYPRKQ